MTDRERAPEDKYEDADLADPRISLLKAHLLATLSNAIRRRGYSQTEAAAKIKIDQPKISELLRGHYERYTLDRLIRFLHALGFDVTIGVRSSDDSRLASDRTRWNEISDPDLLCDLMDERFRQWAGLQRYLRMTSTPTLLESDRVNTADINLRGFVQFPFFGQRANGWYLGMGQGQRELVSTALGLESRPVADVKVPVPLVTLMRSGHFEFWVPFFPWVCFGQLEDSYRAQPGLYPTAVVEFPVSFLQFVRELYRRIGYAGSFIARIEYRNLKSSILHPGPPIGTAAPFLFEGPHSFAEEHYGPYEQLVEPNFDIDTVGLKFATHFYRSFGFERSHIPYFQNGRFTLA